MQALPPPFRLPLMDRDEVAAGVVEYGEDAPLRFGWQGGEHHAQFGHAVVLGLDVVDEEGGRRDALGVERLLVRHGSRVDVWLKEQFQIVRSFRRDDGQPLVVASRHVLLDYESQDFGVERAGFFLIVDEDAGEFDLH